MSSKKADKEYTAMLDSNRRGYPTEETIVKLSNRVVDEPILETYARLTNEGKMPISLFSTRKVCENVNEKLLSTLDSDIVERNRVCTCTTLVIITWLLHLFCVMPTVCVLDVTVKGKSY